MSVCRNDCNMFIDLRHKFCLMPEDCNGSRYDPVCLSRIDGGVRYSKRTVVPRKAVENGSGTLTVVETRGREGRRYLPDRR